MVSVLIFLLLELFFAGLVTYKLVKVKHLFRVSPQPKQPITPALLPSVSLCIPARNETHAMTECIEHALLSTYPKLEIIVLDDGSRDTTQLLIKSFAHAGVRFLEGSALPSNWLGKNHALDTLYRQASGSLIVFADVDTRFEPESIERVVEYMLEENADMVSVMPIRNDTKRLSMRYSTLRHFWTIFGHSRDNPATSSSAWVIKRSVLKNKFDGFSNVSLDVRPELSLARELAKKSLYRFILSSAYIGITSEKKLSSQRETAVRIYFPTFSLFGSAIRILALFAVILPLLVLVAVFCLVVLPRRLNEVWLTLEFSAVYLVVIWSSVYQYYMRSYQSVFDLRTLSGFAEVLIQEMYLIALSVIKYKAGSVTWKGRPIKTK